MSLRCNTLLDLVALRSQRELVDGRKSQASEKQENSPDNDVDMILDLGLLPLKIAERQCLFRLGEKSLSYKQQIRRFARPATLRRHVDRDHPYYFEPGMCCPHPKCNDHLENVMEFKIHAAIVHGSYLSP